MHGFIPLLVVAAGALLVSRYYDLRRIDDPFVTAFAFMSVLWIIGLGLGPPFRAAPQLSQFTVGLLIASYAALVAGGVAAAMWRQRAGRGRDGPALRSRSVSDEGTASLRRHAAALAIGATMVVAFAVVSGGAPVLTSRGEQARVDARAGLGYLVIAAIWLTTVPTVAIVARMYQRRAARRHFVWLGVAVVAVGLAILGNRAPVLVLLIACGWVAVTAHGRLPRRGWLIAGAMVAIGAIAVAGMFRSGADPSLTLAILRLQWQLYVGPSNLERIVDLIPAQVPFLLGRGYAIDLAVLLPGTQPNFGQWLKDAMGLTFPGGGITTGLAGELYANWGPVVAVLGSIVAGFILASIRHRLDVRTPTDSAFVVLLALTAGGVVQSGVTSVLLYGVVPLTAVYVAVRAHAPGSQPAASGPSR
jgi:hypothetical protein